MPTIYKKMKKIEGYVFWDFWGQKLEANIQNNSFNKVFPKVVAIVLLPNRIRWKNEDIFKLEESTDTWKWTLFLEAASLDSSAPGG